MLDAKDNEIKLDRIALRDLKQGPRVGDFIKMLDGSLRRLSHDWSDGFQTTSDFMPGHERFYFHYRGGLNYSGGHDRIIPNASIQDTGETKDGLAWFFHHDISGAHRDVNVEIPCRVYRQIEVK